MKRPIYGMPGKIGLKVKEFMKVPGVNDENFLEANKWYYVDTEGWNDEKGIAFFKQLLLLAEKQKIASILPNSDQIHNMKEVFGDDLGDFVVPEKKA